MNSRAHGIVKVTALLLLIVVWVVGCSVNSSPKFDITTEIVDLTDEDYNSVGTNGIDNPTKSDFRKFNFTLKVNNLNGKGRKIIVPRLETVINSYDNTHRLWFGSSTQQDNDNENFAFYELKYVIFTRGLSEVDLRKMFENKIVTIQWQTDQGEVIKKEFDLGKTIVFE